MLNEDPSYSSRISSERDGIFQDLIPKQGHTHWCQGLERQPIF